MINDKIVPIVLYLSYSRFTYNNRTLTILSNYDLFLTNWYLFSILINSRHTRQDNSTVRKRMGLYIQNYLYTRNITKITKIIYIKDIR
jgi:hypothetical protein